MEYFKQEAALTIRLRRALSLLSLLLALATALWLFTKPAITQTLINPNQIGSGTFPGALTFGAGLTATAGPNSLNAYNLYNTKVIDGVHYAATGAGVASAVTDVLALGGGRIIIPPGTTVNITSGPLQIGTSGGAAGTIKPIKVIVYPWNGVSFNCNFNSSSTDCIQLGDSVDMDCLTPSLTSPNIQVAANANVNTVIAPMNRAGTQESYKLENCSINGNTSGSNIATAVVDLTTMADNTYIARNLIWGYNTSTAAPGLLVAPGTIGGGTMVIEQNWIDASNNSVCYKLTDSGGAGFLQAVNLLYNECQNSGTASMLTITATSANHIRGIRVVGLFGGGGSTNTKQIDVNGCRGCVFESITTATSGSGVTELYFENNTDNTGNVARAIVTTGSGFTQPIFDAQNSFGTSAFAMANYVQPNTTGLPANGVAATTIFNGSTGAATWSGTAPSIAVGGCGGAAASIPGNNGTAFFTLGVGTTPGNTCTVTMPQASGAWGCPNPTDITAPTTTNVAKVIAGTPTSITISNYSNAGVLTNFTGSDVYNVVGCQAR